MLEETHDPDARLDVAQPAHNIGGKPGAAPAKSGAQARRLLPAGPASYIAVAVLAGLGLVGYFATSWWTTGRFQVTTDDAYVGARPATLSSKVAGYVTEIAVADNAVVKAGDLIARIDRGDYELAVQAARNLCDTQRATITRIGSQIAAQHSAVDQAQAQVQSARAGAIKAEADFKRQVELAARKINSASVLDQAQASNEQAKAAVSAAAAAEASAVANVAVLEAQRAEAESTLQQNATALAKAERDLSFTELRAPFDGVIGNRAMQVGDYVQPAQRLASLVPLQEIYVDANFKETQLARLKPGQRVKITVDADAANIIEGHVVSVAPASGSVFSLLPPDNATGNFTKIVQRVPVRIALPPSAVSQALLRPGMSVVVSVNTKPNTELPPKQPASSLTSDMNTVGRIN